MYGRLNKEQVELQVKAMLEKNLIRRDRAVVDRVQEALDADRAPSMADLLELAQIIQRHTSA